MIRPTTLFAIVASAAIGVALFALKYQVRDLEAELTSINRQIIADREAIHVLNAEWSHLNDPERLAALAGRYLQLQPVTADRIGTVAGLPMAADVPVPPSAAHPTLPPAAVGKTPPPRAPAVARNNAADDELARRIAEAMVDGRSPR